MTEEDKKSIEAELRRVEESALYSKESQFVAAKWWRGTNIALGVPASVLAAVAGSTVLASGSYEIWTGIAALAAGALGGIMTTVNAARRAEQGSAAANSYLAIYDAARVLRTVDLPHMERDEARDALAKLIARRDEVNRNTPIPSTLAYRIGRGNILKGNTDYAADA